MVDAGFIEACNNLMKSTVDLFNNYANNLSKIMTELSKMMTIDDIGKENLIESGD